MYTIRRFKKQIILKIVYVTILFLFFSPVLMAQTRQKNESGIQNNSNIIPTEYLNNELKPESDVSLNRKWSADIFFYPQFRFKNAVLYKMYKVQANINPTLHFHMWKGATFTSQFIFPIFNDYSQDESKVRPSYLTLSQQFCLPGNFRFLATAGNFNMQRAGADLKIFKNITNTLGIYGQIGVTGWSVLSLDNWYFSNLNKVNWRVGANYFFKSKDVLMNLNVSKYLENDIAVRGEIIRYFKNASIGFYIQSLQYEDYVVNGGFFFTIALPPRNKRNRKICISTSDNFALEYVARPYAQRGVFYRTAPDENSNFNFFNKFLLKDYK